MSCIINWLIRKHSKPDYEEPTREIKHEHDWRFKRIAEKKTCYVCGRTIYKIIEEECSICGRTRQRHITINEYETVRVWYRSLGGYGGYPFEIYLCKQCHRKFNEEVNTIMTKLRTEIKTFDMVFLGKVRDVVFHNVDSLMKWLKEHAEYITQPHEGWNYYDDRTYYGITFYAKPKNPLEDPYYILIPYESIIDKLREQARRR